MLQRIGLAGRTPYILADVNSWTEARIAGRRVKSTAAPIRRIAPPIRSAISGPSLSPS